MGFSKDTTTNVLVALCFLAMAWTADSNADIPKSFVTSTKRMLFDVQADDPVTFYCGCRYDEQKVVSHGGCGYKPINPDSKRSYKVEAEHVFPAKTMAENLKCYGPERGSYDACRSSTGSLVSGKTCCQRVDTAFKTAHNDIVNLVPAIGEVNVKRRDKAYGVIPGEARIFGECDLELSDRLVEVREDLTGNVARIELYMLLTYGTELKMSVTSSYIKHLMEVHLNDPPDKRERHRNRMICAAQGRANILVGPCP